MNISMKVVKHFHGNSDLNQSEVSLFRIVGGVKTTHETAVFVQS